MNPAVIHASLTLTQFKSFKRMKFYSLNAGRWTLQIDLGALGFLSCKEGFS